MPRTEPLSHGASPRQASPPSPGESPGAPGVGVPSQTHPSRHARSARVVPLTYSRARRSLGSHCGDRLRPALQSRRRISRRLSCRPPLPSVLSSVSLQASQTVGRDGLPERTTPYRVCVLTPRDPGASRGLPSHKRHSSIVRRGLRGAIATRSWSCRSSGLRPSHHSGAPPPFAR